MVLVTEAIEGAVVSVMEIDNVAPSDALSFESFAL